MAQLTLLHTTLQPASAISHAVYGNFSAPRVQEFLAVRGSRLELLRPSEESGKLEMVAALETFSVVRKVLAFRLVGAPRDQIFIANDGGKLTVLEFDGEKNLFVQLHCEPFGKTGCRRIVPGQYLASDPKGRAVMVAAVEKQKLVYVMNRDTSNTLTISSPLEAHKTATITYDIVALDVGFDDPVFAAIEIDYSEADADPSGEALADTEKYLTYYELNLGLNHVTRRWAEPIAQTANLLLAVPGGEDGPSGVLVVSENWVAYKHEGHAEVRTPIPRREGLAANRGTLIVAATMHKQKDIFFYLLQSEYGDVYKVSLTLTDARDAVRDVLCAYFDSLPVAASLCISKLGLLFLAAEVGNHALLQFKSIGDDAEVVSHSVDDEALGDDSEAAAAIALKFEPHAKLQNLSLVDDQSSLAPLTDFVAADLAGLGSTQIYATCGTGSRASLRVLRHGLPVSEMAVSRLPGKPQNIWTVKKGADALFDAYIVVSFANATLVLSIGETVEEVADSGFATQHATLATQSLADGGLVQVHAAGIRHIHGRTGARNEWKTPMNQAIEKACANGRQVCVAVAGGELMYFELDPETGDLASVATKRLGADVCCLDLPPAPEGRLHAPFLAVGCYDNSVRLLSLQARDALLTPTGVKSMTHRPQSLALTSFLANPIASNTELDLANDANPSDGAGGEVGTAGARPALFLHIGLANGEMEFCTVDASDGALGDARRRVLGVKGVTLSRAQVGGETVLLLLDSRPWLFYSHQGKLTLTPISYEALDAAHGFSSEQCEEGVVAISGEVLRIFALERLGETYSQVEVPLRYTPRKVVQVPPPPAGGGGNLLCIIESDHNATEVVDEPAEEKDEMDEEDDEDDANLKWRALPPGESPSWASCVRLVDGLELETVELLELKDNEAAVSVCPVAFADRGGEVFLCVGVVQALQLHPHRFEACSIHTYRIAGTRLILLHKTTVEQIPLGLCDFQGRLLVGVGQTLRLYGYGKKKLLRKCENSQFPRMIRVICVQDERIYVGDAFESFLYVKYRRSDNRMIIFADDTMPRLVTSGVVLDEDTVAGADKFGNIFILRLRPDADDDVDNPTGQRILWDVTSKAGAPNKLECVDHFFVGSVVTGLSLTALSAGSSAAIIYTTISGTVGALLPLASKRDADFFNYLESNMRQEKPPLCGREHMKYRSYYYPVKDCVDGDLCDQFASLPPRKQRSIAQGLEMSPGEVVKKLEDVRARLL